MVDEKVIQAEKEYLVNVLGKKLIDSEERDDNNYSWENTGYRRLAKKYWSEEFDGEDKEVHHINFDHSDNRVCNLVVLTSSEHVKIHWLFDPKYKNKNRVFTNKGNKATHKTREQMSVSAKRRWSNKEEREKMSVSVKNAWNNKELRDAASHRKKGTRSPLKGTFLMNNGKEQMYVYYPWNKDMEIFGWKYGRLKRKA